MKKTTVHLFLIQMVLFAMATSLMCSCVNHRTDGNQSSVDSDSIVSEPDTTFYGICGEGTTMNTVQLITDMQDTLLFSTYNELDNVVKGGLLVGDRLALIAHVTEDGDMMADCVINLTTLLGKWTSIDKNFEICEGGVVLQQVQAEKKPWVSWKILNGNLLLNTDTFQIATLGVDTLELETPTGIFLYKRQ